jgi:hypothetical protein
MCGTIRSSSSSGSWQCGSSAASGAAGSHTVGVSSTSNASNQASVRATQPRFHSREAASCACEVVPASRWASSQRKGSTSSGVTGRPSRSARSFRQARYSAAPSSAPWSARSRYSSSVAGSHCSTRCPSDSSAAAVSSTARSQSGSTPVPAGERVERPIRSRGGAVASAARWRSGSCSRTRVGRSSSRNAAVSRSDRATTNSTSERPLPAWRQAIRSAEGLSPTSPHQAAGIRIEPAPSLA